MNNILKGTTIILLSALFVLIFLILLKSSNLDNLTGFAVHDISSKQSENSLTQNNLELNCAEFKENLLLSSEYNQQKNSTNYKTWYPKNNCTTIRESECFIKTLNVKARFLNLGEINEHGEGYIQISNPEGFICDQPKQGNYERYIAYENITGESQEIDNYCGNNKNPNSKCGVEFSENFEHLPECYGIKIHATKKFIVDTFEVNYKLCWRKYE